LKYPRAFVASRKENCAEVLPQAQNSVRSTASLLPAAERRLMWMQRGVASSAKRCCEIHLHPVATHESQFRPMPRYFFNTRIGDELITDPEGEELRNPDRAWQMARAMILELLKTEGADERLLNATVEVTDDEGEIVLEFPFAEALLDLPGDQQATRH
jgi:hypothetical protein